MSEATTPIERARRWAAGSDTGISSLTIVAVLAGIPFPGMDHHHWCHPCDPADFGRCYRLLQLIPEWRERLAEVAVARPRSAWPEMVPRWGEMERLYEEEVPDHRGSAPRLYALMKEIRKVARDRAKDAPDLPDPNPAHTVRVRIAVVVSGEGEWEADGGDCRRDDDEAASTAEVAMSSGPPYRITFVEADVPLPEPNPEVTVEGEVEDG